MRKRARKDDNHNLIAQTFVQCGLSVADTSALGDGFADMVVGLARINVLVEVKDGAKPPSARKLTKDEQDFHANWRGWIVVVKSVDDALALVQQIRKNQLNGGGCEHGH